MTQPPTCIGCHRCVMSLRLGYRPIGRICRDTLYLEYQTASVCITAVLPERIENAQSAERFPHECLPVVLTTQQRPEPDRSRLHRFQQKLHRIPQRLQSGNQSKLLLYQQLRSVSSNPVGGIQFHNEYVFEMPETSRRPSDENCSRIRIN